CHAVATLQKAGKVNAWDFAGFQEQGGAASDVHARSTGEKRSSGTMTEEVAQRYAWRRFCGIVPRKCG
ncbi:MAG: hypothetical protein ACREOX_04515, partial [Stenotrophomonas sp.]